MKKLRITELKHNFQGPSAKGEPGNSDFTSSFIVH